MIKAFLRYIAKTVVIDLSAQSIGKDDEDRKIVELSVSVSYKGEELIRRSVTVKI